jgi:hypothetical protein
MSKLILTSMGTLVVGVPKLPSVVSTCGFRLWRQAWPFVCRRSDGMGQCEQRQEPNNPVSSLIRAE